MNGKNTTSLNCKGEKDRKLLYYIVVIDISGMTCYLENFT